MACAHQIYSLVILPARIHARVAHHEARRASQDQAAESRLDLGQQLLLGEWFLQQIASPRATCSSRRGGGRRASRGGFGTPSSPPCPSTSLAIERSAIDPLRDRRCLLRGRTARLRRESLRQPLAERQGDRHGRGVVAVRGDRQVAAAVALVRPPFEAVRALIGAEMAVGVVLEAPSVPLHPDALAPLRTGGLARGQLLRQVVHIGHEGVDGVGRGVDSLRALELGHRVLFPHASSTSDAPPPDGARRDRHGADPRRPPDRLGISPAHRSVPLHYTGPP